MSLSPIVSRAGVACERDHALADVQQGIVERGRELKIIFHNEKTSTRDAYNTIKRQDYSTASELNTYAFPLIFNPTQQEQEKAGIKENVQVIAWTATKEWTENGFSINQLILPDSIRGKVVIDDRKYEIKEKNHVSEFADTFLYIVLGLNLV